MENEELMNRIAQLEADAYVLQTYVAMLVGMLPNTRSINGVIADTTRTLNTLPKVDGLPDAAKIQATTGAMRLIAVNRNGLILGQ